MLRLEERDCRRNVHRREGGARLHGWTTQMSRPFGLISSFVHCPSNTAFMNMPVGPLMLVTSTFSVYRPGATVTGHAAKLTSLLLGVKQ